LSFHDNLLSRKGRPRTAATAKAQRQIAEEFRRAKAFDVDTPPASAPAAAIAADSPKAESGSRLGGNGSRSQAGLAPASEPPFTVRTLAERWDCSVGAVRSLIRNRALGHFRVGDLIRVPADEVRRFECRR
jgi:excisionase family DNA binding protein